MEHTTSKRARIVAAALVFAALVFAVIAFALPAAATESPAAGASTAAQSTASSSASATDATREAGDVPASAAQPGQDGVNAETTGSASPNADEGDQAEYVELPGGGEAQAGVVLVKLAEGATVDQLASLDYLSTDSAEPIGDGYVQLKLADGVSVSDALSMLADEEIVAESQPNHVYRLQDDGASGSLKAEAALFGALQATVNDPFVGKQWGLEAVKAFDAWELAKVDKSVTIAFIDSGIDSSHEDLKDNIVATHSYWNTNPQAEDWYGHGTHVAGIASAVTDNALGVAGVSYNASIMNVQALDDEGNATTASMVDALDYVVENAKAHNVRVVNVSIGGKSDVPDTAIDAAIARAHKAGLLIVYAAGNGGTDKWYYPVDFDSRSIGVISAAERDGEYERSSTSNYNDTQLRTKDLTAPGDSVYSTIEDGAYDYSSGTSMATPFVSGVAALVFAVNPDLTAAEAKELLRATTTDIGNKGWDIDTGYGMVNAYAAVRAAKENASYTSAKTDIANAKVALAEADASFLVYDGTAKKPALNVTLDGETLKKGTDYKVVYRNNTKAGTAVALVIGKGSYEGMAKKTFTVKRAPLARVTLAKTSFTYSGKAKKPSATVKDASGKKLVKGTDYTVTYKSNVNAGKAQVIVKGTGNYKGTKKATFTIKRRAITSVSLKKTALAYTGAQRKPAVVVLGMKKGLAKQKLKKGTDYTVTYKSNVNVGKARVTVKGTGNYKGTKKATFTITKRKLSGMKLSFSTYTYTGAKASPSVKVLSYKSGKANQKLKKGTDYTLTVPKGRTNAGTYTYKAVGKGSYKGTVTVTLKVKRAPLASMKLLKSSYVQNGKARTPTVVVRGPKDGKAGQKLTRRSDYALTVPKGRIEPGLYTYKASGRGNYRGTVTAVLTIDKTTSTLNGIDISSWQAGIQVGNVESDFVIVKATGGTGYVNPYMRSQANDTLKAGKLLGFYHYAREVGCAGSAKAEADFFVKNVRDYVGKSILVLDWEQELELGTGWAKVFLDRVYARTGVRPLIYTSKSVTRSYDWTTVAKRYKLWGAQYPDYNETGYQLFPWTDEYGWGAWTNGPTIFQYASTGVLPGYDSYLDLNLFYGNAAYWRTLCKKR